MNAPRRRWFRWAFGLRTLFVVVTTVALLAVFWPPIIVEVSAHSDSQLRAYEIGEYKANWRLFGALGIEVLAVVAWLAWRKPAAGAE